MRKQTNLSNKVTSYQQTDAHSDLLNNDLNTSIVTPLTKPILKPQGTINDMSPRSLFQRGTMVSKQIHKSTQHSKTLMRSGVKKPTVINEFKAESIDGIQLKPGQTTLEKFHSINPERGNRAKVITQNGLVSRFGGELRSAKFNKAKLISAAQSEIVSATSTGIITPSTTASSAAENILARGLRAANSHESVPQKKLKAHQRIGRKVGLSSRAASIATVSFGVIAVSAFLLYQNIPNISVRYASAKAGVNASLPTYQPAGFTINSHVNYSPGEISVSYKANADDRSFDITQKTTNWNSDALKEHLESANGAVPQSFPDSGRTIYLHDNNEADWVNNGVWYSISGNSSLNTDQLIKIATSI